ncbi:MAG: hypothetical protein ACRC57_00150 [Sarcina sp.]
MLYYCTKCARISNTTDTLSCPYCEDSPILQLKKNSPVNVLGSKIKGRLFKELQNTALLIIVTENKEKLLKEYPINELKKIV